jgi:hypothetical protein
MRSFVCACLFCMAYCFSQAQSTSCSRIKYIDQLAMAPSELPIQDFKKYDYNLIPDSVKERIKTEITNESSASFFKGLHVKSAKIFDSTVNEKLFSPVTVYDGNDNPVDGVYVIFYEFFFKDNIPFAFKLVVKHTGELLKKGQFEGIANQKKKIISCSKALAIAAADKEAPITRPGDIYLYYNETFKTIVWQIMEADNTTGDSQHVTVINVFDGEIIERNEFLKGSSIF